MKLALALLAAAVVGVTVATVWMGATVKEDTVVANPYEEGLKLARAAPRAAAGGACDLGATPCTQALAGGGEVKLELAPRPLAAMKELAVRAQLGDAAPEGAEVSVSFSMRGMSMGENRSRLARAAPGRFEGKAVLVRCASGRREWFADVEVAAPGAPPRSARFTLTLAE